MLTAHSKRLISGWPVPKTHLSFCYHWQNIFTPLETMNPMQYAKYCYQCIHRTLLDLARAIIPNKNSYKRMFILQRLCATSWLTFLSCTDRLSWFQQVPVCRNSKYCILATLNHNFLNYFLAFGSLHELNGWSENDHSCFGGDLRSFLYCAMGIAHVPRFFRFFIKY